MRRTFVVGCPRSGTTLVQAMIARHPDVFSLHETFFFESLLGDAELRWAIAKRVRPGAGATAQAWRNPGVDTACANSSGSMRRVRANVRYRADGTLAYAGMRRCSMRRRAGGLERSGWKKPRTICCSSMKSRNAFPMRVSCTCCGAGST